MGVPGTSITLLNTVRATKKVMVPITAVMNSQRLFCEFILFEVDSWYLSWPANMFSTSFSIDMSAPKPFHFEFASVNSVKPAAAENKEASSKPDAEKKPQKFTFTGFSAAQTSFGSAGGFSFGGQKKKDDSTKVMKFNFAPAESKAEKKQEIKPTKIQDAKETKELASQDKVKYYVFSTAEKDQPKWIKGDEITVKILDVDGIKVLLGQIQEAIAVDTKQFDQKDEQKPRHKVVFKLRIDDSIFTLTKGKTGFKVSGLNQAQLEIGSDSKQTSAPNKLYYICSSDDFIEKLKEQNVEFKE